MPPKRKADEASAEDAGEDAGDRQGKDWSHPDGMPLSDVEVDAIYDGVVTNVGKYGVFVNFGAVKDCLLRLPKGTARYFKRGMEVKGMTCISVDVDAGKAVMEIDEENLPDPPPKGQRRDLEHDDGMPLAELEVGQVYEGKVMAVNPSGVFVDIGAVRDARLSVSMKIGRRFRIGDIVQDCTIERIDLEANRLSCTLPDPEGAVADLPLKDRSGKATGKAKAKATGKGQTKGSAKGKVQAKAKAQENRRSADDMDLDRLEIDDYVDGVVVNKSLSGVFVDIGCGKDARLSIAKKLGVRLMRGDHIEGMRIESLEYDPPRISVALDNAEDVVAAIEKAAKRSGSAPRGSRSVGPAVSNREPAPKAKAKARASSAGAAPSKERRNGLPLNRFRQGQTADGVVTSVTAQGVYVDIGARFDGFLSLPRSIAKQFRVSDEVHGMVIEGVDAAAEKILLTLEEPELEGPVPPPKPKGKARASAGGGAAGTASAGAARGGGSAKARAAPKSRPSTAGKDFVHPGGVELEDLYDVEEVSCIVTNVSPFGVYVDVGAIVDGRLNIPRVDVRKFLQGDRIDGAFIEEVNLEAGTFTVGLPDDMLAQLADAPIVAIPSAPPPRTPARASGASRSPARPSSQAATAPATPRTAAKSRPTAKGQASATRRTSAR